MNRKIALGITALIGLSAVTASVSAEARPLPYPARYYAAAPMVPARHWRGYPRYYGRHFYGPPPGYHYGRGYYYNDGAAALGLLGGLALGGALAAGPDPYYYGPVCHIVRREVWVPGWGYRIRSVEICN